MTKSKVYVLPKKKCHIGFNEIVDNLFIGREADLTKELLSKLDLIVPLCDLNGTIWNLGYRKDICYLPIVDYSVLPKDVEKKYVQQIADRVKKGDKVAICCYGGHGRTGYIASLVLHELGIKSPIEYIRKNYCSKAVESNTQIKAIADYTNDESILEKYDVYYGVYYEAYGYKSSHNTDAWQDWFDMVDTKTCGDCGDNINGECLWKRKKVGNADKACNEFLM